MITPCMIVDDEPLARDVLVKYIANCPILELAAVCKSAFEAIEILKNKDIRILFLDINMPQLSGLSMVRTMDNPPNIIFTTAYPEYAVEGFEVDAADYLVKPFSFERFMKAVNKAIQREEYIRNRFQTQDHNERKYFRIKADGKIYQLDYDRIKYFEAFGDYVKVHTDDKTIITHDTLKNVEKNLPAKQFMRVHRSYIISLDKIEYIEGNRVKIGQEFIPVGDSYKENLETYLGSRGGV